MLKKVFAIFSYGIFSWTLLFGQCPGNDSLWKRLVYLRDYNPLSAEDQLQEFLKFENAINHCSFHYDSTHAFLLQRIGAMYYRQSDYLNSLHYIQKSINLIHSHIDKPDVNPHFLILDYYALSLVDSALGMMRERMVALDSCAFIAERLKSINLFALQALYNRVVYFIDIGDYKRSISYAIKCTKLAGEYAKHVSSVDSADVVSYIYSCLVWQLNAFIQLNDFESAEKLLFEKINEYKKNLKKYNLGALFDQMAIIQLHKKNYEKAVLYFNDALTCHKQNNFDLDCKITLHNLAYEVYFKQYHDWKKTLIAYRKALAFVNKDPSLNKQDSLETLNIFADIANVYVEESIYDSAFKYFQLSFDQIKKGTNETELANSSAREFIKNKDVNYLANLVIDKGDAYQHRFNNNNQVNDIREAVRVYKTADQLLGKIKTEQSELQSKLSWRTNTRRLYEHAIAACNKYNNAEDAFYFFEKSRAVLLNDDLNVQHWLGEKDIFKLAQLKKKILQSNRELNNLNSSSAQYTALQNELFANNQELNSLMENIKIKNPLYFQSFLDTNIISMRDVQKNILQTHQAFVEMYVGDSSVYCMIITNKQSHINKIDKNVYEELVSSYNFYISNEDLLNKDFPAFIKISQQLYQLIFQNEKLPKGRIIISPSGRYFPFEALVMNTEPLKYFLDDYAVSYAYSARYLFNRFGTETETSFRNFAGFSPLHFPDAAHLAELPGSEKSLEKLQSYFSYTDNFIGHDASKNNFLEEYSKYKIIQLYTHASDSSGYGEPEIWFADSALYLSDLISENKPVTNLIVLSACQTGTGKVYEGEGVFSFNRGFAAIGIPSSITNLWSVDDASTYRITEIFYKNLATGDPLDIALQKAKIEFINLPSIKNKLPCYWAAAILTGKTNSIELKRSDTYKIIFILAAAVACLCFIIWWKWMRRVPVTAQS